MDRHRDVRTLVLSTTDAVRGGRCGRSLCWNGDDLQEELHAGFTFDLFLTDDCVVVDSMLRRVCPRYSVQRAPRCPESYSQVSILVVSLDAERSLIADESWTSVEIDPRIL